MAAPTRPADSLDRQLAGILKDAAFYALGAFALCVPLVSFRTDPGSTGGLELTPRWGLVAALCAAIFLARLVQRLILMRRDARRAARPRGARRRKPSTRRRMPGSACRGWRCGCSSASR